MGLQTEADEKKCLLIVTPSPLLPATRLLRQSRLVTLAFLIVLIVITYLLVWTVDLGTRFQNAKITEFTWPPGRCAKAFFVDPLPMSEDHQRWAATDRDDCDVVDLAAVWDDLTELYQTNPPHPARVIRTLWNRAVPSQLGEFTAEMADAHLPLSRADAMITREAHRQVIESLPPYNSVSHTFQGQGIVIVAGSRYAGYAATSVGVLRLHGSKLPVEIWAKDDDEEDLAWCEELSLQGVACRRISDYAPVGSLWDWINPLAWLGTPVPWSPYQWKVMAILFSSFEEVLFLDADSIPVQDPAFLFESEIYREKGAIIWPDYWQSIASHWLPYILDITETKSSEMWHQPTAEAGQMLWNKRVHWKVRS